MKLFEEFKLYETMFEEDFVVDAIENQQANPNGKIAAIVFKHGVDDYSIWSDIGPMSAEDELQIQSILAKYRNTGGSDRGSKKELIDFYTGATSIVEAAESDKISAKSECVYLIRHEDGKRSVAVKRDENNNVKSVYVNGNAFLDSICYFNTRDEAVKYMNKVAKTLPDEDTLLKIIKAKADLNGYLEVDTKFGKCLIKASTLNESADNEMPYNIVDDLIDDYNSTYASSGNFEKITRASVVSTSRGGCKIYLYLANPINQTAKNTTLCKLFIDYVSNPQFRLLLRYSKLVNSGAAIAFPAGCLNEIGIDSMDPWDFM